jgi:hypothetical protein
VLGIGIVGRLTPDERRQLAAEGALPNRLNV